MKNKDIKIEQSETGKQILEQLESILSGEEQNGSN